MINLLRRLKPHVSGLGCITISQALAFTKPQNLKGKTEGLKGEIKPQFTSNAQRLRRTPDNNCSNCGSVTQRPLLRAVPSLCRPQDKTSAVHLFKAGRWQALKQMLENRAAKSCAERRAHRAPAVRWLSSANGCLGVGFASMQSCLFSCTWEACMEQDHHSAPSDGWCSGLPTLHGTIGKHWERLGIHHQHHSLVWMRSPCAGFITATESFITVNIKQYSVWILCTVLPYKKQLMSSDPWYMKQLRFITSWQIMLWQQRIPFVPDLVLPKTSFSPSLILSLGADPLILGR